MAGLSTVALPEGQPFASLDDMERVISRVLQLGVVVSVCIVAAGVVLWAIHGAAGQTEPLYPTTVGGVWLGLLLLDPLAVIQCGLLVLIFTPVVRVAASVLVFVHDRDRPFTIITLVVLALLLFGVFHGGAG